MPKRRFIRGAIRKPGALRAQLGVKKGKKIPAAALTKISRAKVGSKVSVGGKSRTVTAKLKRRAVLAKTLRKLRG